MSARDAILKRLRQRAGGELTAPERDYAVLARPDWSREERLDRFRQAIESVHGEVHRTSESQWVGRLAELLLAKGARNLLAPRLHPIGQALRQSSEPDLPPLLDYSRPITEWQPELFNEGMQPSPHTRGHRRDRLADPVALHR